MIEDIKIKISGKFYVLILTFIFMLIFIHLMPLCGWNGHVEFCQCLNISFGWSGNIYHTIIMLVWKQIAKLVRHNPDKLEVGGFKTSWLHKFFFWEFLKFSIRNWSDHTVMCCDDVILITTWNSHSILVVIEITHPPINLK